MTGDAKVTSSSKQGSWKIGFSIENMSEANTERLESALFDAVLSRIR